MITVLVLIWVVLTFILCVLSVLNSLAIKRMENELLKDDKPFIDVVKKYLGLILLIVFIVISICSLFIQDVRNWASNHLFMALCAYLIPLLILILITINSINK